MQRKLFNQIPVLLPREKIFLRMGYSFGKTKLTGDLLNEVERYLEDGQSLLDLRGVACRLDIEKITETETIFSNSISFDSASVAEFLKGSCGILIFSATGGSRISQAISLRVKYDNMTAAVVFDALASEIVDSSLTWIMNYYNRQLSCQGLKLTSRRFSAGYGDFSITNQKKIYDCLNLFEFGVTITDNFMLLPEKTVTAIAGIERISQ